MKLHLPKSLLAAVTLAVIGALQTSAATTATTTDYNGKTYSGFIFKPTAISDLSGSTYSQVGTAVNGDTQGTGATGVSGQAMIDNVGGTTGTTSTFYNYYTTGQSVQGNTLLLSAQTTNKTLTANTSIFALGGLITEGSDYKWTLGRGNSNTAITLIGNTAGVNLTLGSNTELLSATNKSITVATGGDWAIANGKTLTLNTPTVTINKGQTVNVSILDGSEGDTATVAVTGNLAGATSGSGSKAALNIASGVTLQMNSGILNLGALSVTNNGTIALGDDATIRLYSVNGLYEDGQKITLGGNLTYSSDSPILGDLGTRQEASYANGVITINTTKKATLTWTGEDHDQWHAANTWVDEDGQTDALQTGDSIRLSEATTGLNLWANTSLKLDTITAETDHGIDVHSGATLSGKIVTEGNATITKWGNSTLVVNDGSEVHQLVTRDGTSTINDGANIGTIAAYAGTTNINDGASVGSLTVNGGKVNLNTTKLVSTIEVASNHLVLANGAQVGDLTRSGGQFYTANGAASTTLTGTITINQGTTEQAVVSAKEGNAEFKNIQAMDNTLRTSSSTADDGYIKNTDITIKSNYSIGQIDLSESSVTVNDGVTLSSYRTKDGATLTLGELTVGSGASLDQVANTYIKYTGSINLSLNDLTDGGSTLSDDTLPAFSTSVLPGTMQSGSSLTLNLDAVEALSSYQKGDSFVLTLDGLTLDSGYTVTENSFSATGWDVVYDEAMQGTGYTALTLTKAVPEPTTATLSLLALAGLAARRRRK